jgi:hypothetical protein
MARWRRCSQVVDGDDDSKVPGDGEEADGVRLDAGKAIASSACSFSSRREGGRRLETVPGSWRFGCARGRRFAAALNQKFV